MWLIGKDMSYFDYYILIVVTTSFILHYRDINSSKLLVFNSIEDLWFCEKCQKIYINIPKKRKKLKYEANGEPLTPVCECANCNYYLDYSHLSDIYIYFRFVNFFEEVN